MKKSKKLFLSSLLIFMPMLFGICMYRAMPHFISSHWNIYGENDGFLSKGVFVFGFPFLFLLGHLLTLWVVERDNAKRNQSPKMMNIIYFIVPVISLLVQTCMYAIAFGYQFDITACVFVILAIMFIGLGNYLPKTTQNMTIGVRTTWTLNSKDNWYHTHRFTGLVWVIGGICLLLDMFMPITVRYHILTILVLGLSFAPILYSFAYYVKEVKQGTYEPAHKSTSLIGTIVGLVLTAVTLLVVAIVLFTGKITYTISKDGINMDATYYREVSIAYKDIDTVTYLQEDDAGTRKFGWGSYKLLLGTFENQEENQYIRYTYKNVDNVIRVQRKDGEVIIFNAESDAATKLLYEEILSNLE